MDNLNNISYADNWKKASNPIKRVEPENKTPEENKKTIKKKAGIPLLTLIQIILCLLIVLTAFVIKLINTDIYATAKDAYEAELNNEIILNPYENSLDKLFDTAEN